jgi:hypothetical protein
MMMTRNWSNLYTGLVQAKAACHFGGFLYRAGAVFDVKNVVLWSDDPYEAVEFVGLDDEAIAVPPWTKKVARYARINVAVQLATLRPTVSKPFSA